jgi:diacylglycerol O-acyltransferase / wax synthase
VTSYPRLSALDALFLHLESAHTPMHSGSVAVFDGHPLPPGVTSRVDLMRATVAERLHMVPKLRQRVWFPVGRQGRPVWVDDPEFEIARHVRHTRLRAPGSETQLTELAAELLSDPLDRARPLWELWLIEGLAGGRFAYLEKIHHALADGLAAVELATVLLDFRAEATTSPAVAPPWRPHSNQPGAILTSILFDRGLRNLRTARALWRDALHPLASARAMAGDVAALRTLGSPQLVAPRSSINAPVGRGRSLRVVRPPLDRLRRVEKAFDVTINDILLAAVAGGLGEMLAGRGELGDEAELQALVPVATSLHGDRALGNQVAAMVVRLPVAEPDPRTRLRQVAQRVARVKASRQARATALLLRGIEVLPNPILSAAAPLVHHQPFVNLIVTNVPGPQVPLYSLGSRMLDVIPVVPLAGNLSLGVAAFSYDRRLSVGVFADRDRCPDIDVLADGIESSFGELVLAARHKAPAPKPTRRSADAGGRTGRAQVG